MVAEPNYTYKATFVRAKDGDTYVLILDFGKFAGVRALLEVDVRLQGIDTWEMKQPLGFDAMVAAESSLLKAKEILVRTYKPTGVPIGATFERTKADVWVDGVSMVEIMEPYRKHAS